ncbi:MAG: SIS domain-containing protein [Halothiobacillaceae bacterium]|jgi:D-sedoheptulose 7-phosphate isomerase|nr:SIS domain-containing protein [Halothiobacillaceae bacterium]MDY0050735.1 SIS domain-containing protein [Halothiobacillaceae bacterium]
MPSPVEQRLRESLDGIESALQPIGDELMQAAGLMLHTVIGGQRLLVCGVRERATLAAHFARLMVGQFEHERPGLPAIALQEFPGGEEPYAKAIRALGGGGDVLFAIGRDGLHGLEPALRAARERDMRLVILTSGQSEHLRPSFSADDSLLCLPPGRARTLHEAQLVAVHLLCDLIDRQLLGLE